MLKKTLVIVGGLIALYLVVENATGSGTLITKGASGASTVVKSLQGRT